MDPRGEANYFLAGLLDDRTTRHVTKYLLKGHPPEIHKNTLAENLHVTIGYIGPIREEDLPSVVQVMNSLQLPPPLPVSLVGLGLYGGANNHKKYFGINVEDTVGLLQDLRDKVDQRLNEQTFYHFRKNHWENFRPHITVQRLKKELTLAQMKEIQSQFLEQPLTPYPFFIYRIALWYKNRTTGRYDALWERELD